LATLMSWNEACSRCGGRGRPHGTAGKRAGVGRAGPIGGISTPPGTPSSSSRVAVSPVSRTASPAGTPGSAPAGLTGARPLTSAKTMTSATAQGSEGGLVVKQGFAEVGWAGSRRHSASAPGGKLDLSCARRRKHDPRRFRVRRTARRDQGKTKRLGPGPRGEGPGGTAAGRPGPRTAQGSR